MASVRVTTVPAGSSTGSEVSPPVTVMVPEGLPGSSEVQLTVNSTSAAASIAAWSPSSSFSTVKVPGGGSLSVTRNVVVPLLLAVITWVADGS